MIARPKVGEFMSNVCPRCQRAVRSRVEVRSVQLARTRLVVRDVPVDVCPDCDHMISFAPHAVEQLREAGWAK